MSRRLTIGIVVPVYNRSGIVCDALDSIAKQSRRPDQVIVIDDGSTDGSSEAVRNWMAKTGFPLEVVERQNGGIAAARNTGFRRLQTDVIGALDSDDLYEPNCLERLAAPLESNAQLLGSYGGYRKAVIGDPRETANFVESTRHSQVPFEMDADGNRIMSAQLFEALVYGSFIHVGASLVRRECAARTGWMNESFPTSEDMDYFLRLCRLGRFAYCPEVVLTVRMHSMNTTGRLGWRIAFDNWRVLGGVLADSTKLELTPEEEAVIRTRRQSLVPEILYEGSCEGPKAYWNALQALRGRDGMPQARELLRSTLRALYAGCRPRAVPRMKRASVT